VAAQYETLAEAAARLDVHPRTLRRRVAEGRLTAYRLDGSTLIRLDPAAVDQLLRPIPTGAA
jgi:excisionase family DNA binding protein